MSALSLLNFESVVSNKWLNVQRHLPSVGVNVKSEYEIMKKYNYLEVDAGKMSQRSAYNEAPNDSKCKSSGGINCSSDTASQTKNAETIFPRNGFMQW